MTIQKTIDIVCACLEVNVREDIILFTLMVDGFSLNRSKTIIRWAKKTIESRKENNG